MKIDYQILLAKQDANPILHQWRGGLAKLFSYTASHSILEIRLTSEQRSGNHLTILCGDVETIHGPTVWFSCDLETEKVGDRFILRDKTAGFEVYAGAIGVQENQNPYT